MNRQGDESWLVGRRLVVGLALCILAGAALFVTSTHATAGTTWEIDLTGDGFVPAGVRAQPGDSVRWTNRTASPQVLRSGLPRLLYLPLILRPAANSAAVAGALVTLMARGPGGDEMWNAAALGQLNPQSSNAEGRYGWNTTPGSFYVRVSKPCYADAQSRLVTVPPPVTNLDVGLTPRACSPVQMSSAEATDRDGRPLDLLRPGAPLRLLAKISDSASTGLAANTSVAADYRLELLDAQGRPVPGLTRSGSVPLTSGENTLELTGTAPSNSEGEYTFAAWVTYNQQTTFRGHKFRVGVARAQTHTFLPLLLRDMSWAPARTATATASRTRTATATAGTATPTRTPTLTRTRTVTPTATTPASGIYGKVTYHNAAASGLRVDLRRWDGAAWLTQATTATAQDGGYLFTGAPALASGEFYAVRYLNNPADPNPGAGYLWSWLGNRLAAYTAGASVRGGDFDVADIPLVSPANATEVTLPAQFCWTPRGVAGDSYRLAIYNGDKNETAVTPYLGSVACVNLTSIPGDWPSGAVYTWWAEAGQGADPNAAPYNRGASQGDRLVTINHSALR